MKWADVKDRVPLATAARFPFAVPVAGSVPGESTAEEAAAERSEA